MKSDDMDNVCTPTIDMVKCCYSNFSITVGPQIKTKFHLCPVMYPACKSYFKSSHKNGLVCYRIKSQQNSKLPTGFT